jgi:transposase InsO family protein
MKFAFIHAEKEHFPVKALCRVLGVTRQGYYASVQRGVSQRFQADVELQSRIAAIHRDSGETYGSPRVRQQLRRDGLGVSKRRVEKNMRALGLVGRAPRRFRVTTRSDPNHRIEPNILDRDFTASRPNERWVTDITYISTGEGWCYLAVILDLYSRAVVGWALDTTLTTALPIAALHNALIRRQPSGDLLHHSDRGCQYTGDQYRAALAELGITVSMSRKGNCWDNAVAESFFSTLKNEIIYRKPWKTRVELHSAVFEYIEAFYNRRRLHSAVGYRPPAEVETDYALAQAA